MAVEPESSGWHLVLRLAIVEPEAVATKAEEASVWHQSIGAALHELCDGGRNTFRSTGWRREAPVRGSSQLTSLTGTSATAADVASATPTIATERERALPVGDMASLYTIHAQS